MKSRRLNSNFLKRTVLRVVVPWAKRIVFHSGITHDLTQTRNDLTQTRNDLTQTRNDLTQTRNDLTQTRNDLTQTRNDLTQTRNDLTQTRNDLTQTRNGILKKIFWQNVKQAVTLSSNYDSRNTRTMDLKYVLDKGAGLIAFPSFDSVMSERIIESGIWENSEQKWIELNTQADSVVINAGANVGIHSIVAASKIGEKGRVIAFECHREIIDILRLNLIANGALNVEVVGYAVGEIRENRLLFLNPKNSGDNRLKHSDELVDDGIEVGVIRLEDYCKENSLIPNLVVMDVQGFELAAIRGLGNALAEKGKILFELTPRWIDEDLNVSKMQLDEILTSGFSLFMLSENGIENPVTTKEVFEQFLVQPDLLYMNLVIQKQ
jgi:FkbM family methyltransferase